MLRSGVFWKLYAGYVTLVLASALAVGILVSRKMESESLAEVRRSLTRQAVLLREITFPSTAGAGTTGLQQRVQDLGRDLGTRLTVVTPDGTVIADSHEEPGRMDNHANRSEIETARSRGAGEATRASATMRADMMYLAMGVLEDDELVGFVRTALPLEEVYKRLERIRTVVALGAAVGVLVALLLGFFMARHFSGPLASMTDVAESMAAGNYDLEVDVRQHDEVGRLAEALNRMARSSRERMETIATDKNELSAILAGMVEGVVAVDKDRTLVHVNAAAATILGLDPEAATGSRLEDAVDIPNVADALLSVLDSPGAVDQHARSTFEVGQAKVEMQASPLRDLEGRVAGAVAVLHDVTELHRLETVRQDFVANASHELKTPITAIRGLVETLIDDQDMPADSHERFLAKIRDQSLRLSSVVTDLLTLSRLESGEGLAESVPVDLRDILVRAERALAPVSDRKRIAVETVLPESPVEIDGDEEALAQMANNLLDNALKYTPEGGNVWLRLTRDQGQAVLEVEDTGVGIEPEHQERVFERFYRVDKARSRQLGGTGLGLSIVKRTALAYGGSVSLESRPGEGTAFRVLLPVQPC